jgi:fructosamine-3-kinase
MSVLPEVVRAELAALLGTDGARLEARTVAGGCISPTARVDAPDGPVFVKWNPGHMPAGMLAEEAAALGAIGDTRTVRVPGVVGVTNRVLVLEWLEPGTASHKGWQTLGRMLAGLHRTTSPAWGWPRDNFIGTVPQSNTWSDSGTAFFRERRILPRLEAANAAGAFDGSDRTLLERFVATLPDILRACEADRPSLVHGDLWSGNAHALADGGVALVDPASSFGHREMDLAMAELFGGFPGAFFDAYEGEWPTAPEGRTHRRAAFRVYYLLVHVNLFGGSYARATVAAARAALG